MHKFSSKNLGRSIGCGKLLVTAGHEQSKKEGFRPLVLAGECLGQDQSRSEHVSHFLHVLLQTLAVSLAVKGETPALDRNTLEQVFAPVNTDKGFLGLARHFLDQVGMLQGLNHAAGDVQIFSVELGRSIDQIDQNSQAILNVGQGGSGREASVEVVLSHSINSFLIRLLAFRCIYYSIPLGFCQVKDLLNPQLARIDLDRRGVIITDNVSRTRGQVDRKVNRNSCVPSGILNAPVSHQIPVAEQMDSLVTMAFKTLNSGIRHCLSLTFCIYYTTGA